MFTGPRSYEWPARGDDHTPDEAVYEPQKRPRAQIDNRVNSNLTRDIIELFNWAMAHASDHAPGNDLTLEEWYVTRDEFLPLNLKGHDLHDEGDTIWDATNEHIRQTALQHSTVGVLTGQYLTGGGQISLGNSRTLDVDTDALAGDFLLRDGSLPMTGDLDFGHNEAVNYRVENRTSDPSNPAAGREWLRTDL